MSVLEKKRSLSDMEFYKNALRLNQAVAEWLMRDFGTRRNPRSVNQVIKDISESDQKIIDNIFSKYGCSSKHEFVSEFPEWYVERKRTRLLDLCDDLIENIVNANKIFPSKEYLHEEYGIRREFQWMAVCNCEDIKQVLQGIARDFHIDINKIQPIIDKAGIELELLKSWRHSDNKQRRNIERELVKGE